MDMIYACFPYKKGAVPPGGVPEKGVWRVFRSCAQKIINNVNGQPSSLFRTADFHFLGGL